MISIIQFLCGYFCLGGWDKHTAAPPTLMLFSESNLEAFPSLWHSLGPFYAMSPPNVLNTVSTHGRAITSQDPHPSAHKDQMGHKFSL